MQKIRDVMNVNLFIVEVEYLFEYCFKGGKDIIKK